MDRYSRLVAFFKVLLPLAALAILATLFLLSRSQDISTTIPFTEADVTSRMRDQQVTKPFFSGTTAKGEEILVSADAARPGGQGDPGSANNLSARIKLADGRQIKLKSETGSVNPISDMATFQGNVRIATSTGLVVLTDMLDTALSGIDARSKGEVTATGPMGDLTAGQMQITSKSDSDDVHVLFKNGVKLIYRPKQPER
ncbi:LPS export ABC transporter periplasmic protein LptC [Sedimentitalea sp. HM32M-2]|uniref:LPS export ABC transporter periplasmic protein LptC n=1 Tax=Sedimentitalea sp. HM32M-2 TaxID=3351566 RepID=UPI0036391D1E